MHDPLLMQFPNLKSLGIPFNNLITDKFLMRLTNLIHLDIRNCKKITNDSLKYLSNLTSLTTNDRKIISSFLQSTNKLVSLDVSFTDIDDNILLFLDKLQSLYIAGYNYITNKNLSILTNLTTLDLSYKNEKIKKDTLKCLTKLQTLNLKNCYVSKYALITLTNLTSLNIKDCYKIKCIS